MEISSNLTLPYILPQQAQKHVTHNEAIRMLDALVQLSVKARNESDPPANPAEGNRYALSDSPTGVWEGQGGKIAAFQDGAWTFFVPQTGWILWDEKEEETLVWDGSGWQPAFSVPSSLDGLTGVGINTAPDATNLLAVKSDAILFSHDDATPGSGDLRQVLNKAATADTASTLFQTGFSGRAEFGLTGDDNWHVKVSPDGSNWHESIVIDSSSGWVALGHDQPEFALDVRADTMDVFQITANEDVAPGVGINFAKGRGTLTSPTTSLAGDTIGVMRAKAHDGTEYQTFANIRYKVDDISGTDISGRFEIACRNASHAMFNYINIYGASESIELNANTVKAANIATTAASANAVLDTGNGNSLLVSTSSERYKKNIEPLEVQHSAALMAVRPVWYRSNSAADNPGWSWYGFTAEDVAAIDPRMVHWGFGPDDYETVDEMAEDGLEQARRLKAGAIPSPQGVAYDRFVVHHHQILKEILYRLDQLENRGNG